MEPIEGILLDKEGNPVPLRGSNASRARMFSLGPVTGPLIGGAIILLTLVAGLTIIGTAIAAFLGFFLLRSVLALLTGWGKAPRPARLRRG